MQMHPASGKIELVSPVGKMARAGAGAMLVQVQMVLSGGSDMLGNVDLLGQNHAVLHTPDALQCSHF